MLKPMVMIRKDGAKYPGKLLKKVMTWNMAPIHLLQEGLLGHTSRVLLVDDLIATGGSMLAAKKLVEQTGAKVVGAATVINLKYLNSSELRESLDIYCAGKVLS